MENGKKKKSPSTDFWNVGRNRAWRRRLFHYYRIWAVIGTCHCRRHRHRLIAARYRTYYFPMLLISAATAMIVRH